MDKDNKVIELLRRSDFEVSFGKLQREVYAGSEKRGFHDEKKNDLFVASSLALIASEVSEALECDRRNTPKEMPWELADIVIRTMDLAEHLGINLGKAIEEKHNFNEGRKYRHGYKRY